MEAISRAEGGVSAENGSPSGSFFGEETQNLQWSKKNRDMFLRIHMTPVSQIKGRPMFTASSVIMFRSDSRPTTCLVGDRNKRMARQIATQLGEAPLPFVTSQGDKDFFPKSAMGKDGLFSYQRGPLMPQHSQREFQTQCFLKYAHVLVLLL